MKTVKSFVASTLLILGSSVFCVASATTIHFDDIIFPASPIGSVAGGYQGFNWSGGLGAASWAVSADTGSLFQGVPAISVHNFAWNNGGTDLTMTTTIAEFSLNSFWGRMGSAVNGQTTLHGFLGGVEVLTQTLNLTKVYQKLNLNSVGIDTLTFSNQGANILLDDIAVSSVPEPESYAMMVAGLGIVGFLARRRRKY